MGGPHRAQLSASPHPQLMLQCSRGTGCAFDEIGGVAGTLISFGSQRADVIERDPDWSIRVTWARGTDIRPLAGC